MNKAYKLIAGGAPQAFHNSRAKVRMYAGGFGNGKTTALVYETLRIAVMYPGISIMMARNTFTKLEQTLGREFMKWCPSHWIKQGTVKGGTVSLINGTTIDFRYLSQASNSTGDSSSNLLSANYGLIVVDQIEDPEITEKDFDDMLGRLRESVPKADGEDESMPATGPRMILLSANPSLGWVYTKLVKPVYDMREGIYNDDLLCVRNPTTGEPVLDKDGCVQPLIELFEASTYDNAQNLDKDFLTLLESKYRGKMRDRYVLGKWVAFDGVVYNEYDPNIHRVSDRALRGYISSLRASGQTLSVVESYDLGITSPSCYLYAEVDAWSNVYITDGFYKPGYGINEQVAHMRRIRGDSDEEIRADPQIFKVNTLNGNGIGKSPAMLFAEQGIPMCRASNQKLAGIMTVKEYLVPQKTVVNPFTGEFGSPKLFFSDKLTWLHEEFTTWRWKKNNKDENIDDTVDGDDHAMDALKYMLSRKITPGKQGSRKVYKLPKQIRAWSEGPDSDDFSSVNRKHRYA